MSIVQRLHITRSLDRAVRDIRPRQEGLTVERMRKRDLRAVLAIENQVYPRPWTPGTFHGELTEMKAGRRDYLVARTGDGIVGYGGIMLVLDEAHVSNIAVDPRWQRYGIGRRLLLELSFLARAHGCSSMSLEVRVSNTAAQALYESFGFAAEGVRRKYYENVEDAIIMWRRDVDSVEFAAWLAEQARLLARGGSPI